MTVGAGAGFAGDRVDQAVKLASSGRCDAVVLECLAERTLVQGLEERRSDPDRGYDTRLRRRLAPLLPAAVEHGCAIVSNLGSANPLGAADAVVQLSRELDLGHVRTAVVTGDDILDRVDEVLWDTPLGQGELLGAHVYLGAEVIGQAVAQGADLVLTGRVADASLFVGALAPIVDSNDARAGATVVGHLLECAGQVTGGNYQPPGGNRHVSAQGLAELGYPLATVETDGSAVIWKLRGTGGRIDRLTCTLQLLYEVHDPAAYVTPDVTVDFTDISMDQVDVDRIRVSGAKAVAVPEALKVIGFLRQPGVVTDLEISYTGIGALERARLGGEVLQRRLEPVSEVLRLQTDIVGVDSVLRGASLPLLAEPPEVRLHASAVCADGETALAVEDEVYALTLSGPAGGCGIRCERRDPIEVVSGKIGRQHIDAQLHWVAAGR